MDERNVEATDGTWGAGDDKSVVVGSWVSDLSTDHPLLNAGIKELVSIGIIGLHWTVISAKEDLVKSLIVKDIWEAHRCEVRVFKFRCDILNFIALKHLVGNLKTVNVEKSLISHNSELNVLSSIHIRINRNSVNSSCIANQAASYNQATLQVPDRKIVFSLHTHWDKVLCIVREGKCLHSSLMEGIFLDQLSVNCIIEIDERVPSSTVWATLAHR